MLSAAAFIASHDLRYMLRQKETLLWVFVMPIVFFYFIGSVTGGSGGNTAGQPTSLALQAPANGGVIVEQLVRRLEEQNYAVERPATPDAFDRYSRRLTIPEVTTHPTVTESVLAGNQLEVTFERRGDDLGASLDEVRLNRAVYAVVADLAVIKSSGRSAVADEFAAIAATPRRLTLTVRAAGKRVEAPSGFSQAVPGTMVMFTMLVLLTSGAITLVVQRELGLLRRLASTPISRGSIVLGKWAARMAIALVQLAFAMVVGGLVFGVDWGPSVLMVIVVLVGWAAFCASLALLLGNLARTQGQTAGIGILSSMVLAALGGCWWPIEITPAWMQTLATFLPTGWTMDAMHKLVNFADAPSAALPHVAALAASAVIAGWGGARWFRYQ
jgi:ABC-2 type transport system permease protein